MCVCETGLGECEEESVCQCTYRRVLLLLCKTGLGECVKRRPVGSVPNSHLLSRGRRSKEGARGWGARAAAE